MCPLPPLFSLLPNLPPGPLHVLFLVVLLQHIVTVVVIDSLFAFFKQSSTPLSAAVKQGVASSVSSSFRYVREGGDMEREGIKTIAKRENKQQEKHHKTRRILRRDGSSAFLWAGPFSKWCEDSFSVLLFTILLTTAYIHTCTHSLPFLPAFPPPPLLGAGHR